MLAKRNNRKCIKAIMKKRIKKFIISVSAFCLFGITAGAVENRWTNNAKF